ncbi:cardiac ryanodine receptor [Salpingoeca rosetta]|uniref:Cardiac ryanodine receptor n=1 Tax=Salpingoeca rosetta (strain ATCC 50818 / BSB-021) TaxID=946362 RepID=F2ULG4_SALR5|nr:cardiac ryanodine receptor [Salpingoeca rosetta]EGD77963.1 cardiac ryanodine receptor [Salpingoeca rosetta]|eukprot:XP_004990026.1 cardiac ryanodine receptor [Salpingoeca rosetta]
MALFGGASQGAGRTALCNGDFVSLFVEELKGFASVDILSTREVTVYQGDTDSAFDGSTSTKSSSETATAPNFEQSCVFQIKAVTDLPEGASLKYGDVVRIIHRSTQRSMTRQNRAVNGKHAVALENTDRAAAHFRLLPRFKIRSVGEPVLLNDQVIFQNEVVIEGNRTYLMTDRPEDSPKVLMECGSSKTTGIRVRLFAAYNVSSKAFVHVLKGGDFVRLFHHEANGFLVVARHIGTGDAHDFLGRDNTVCLRTLAVGRSPDEYHDASSIWQVELEDTQRRGGRPVLWTDRVRLKNVLTNEFLDVRTTSSTGAMAPTADKGSSNLFSFVQSTHSAQEGDAPATALLSRQEDLRIPYHTFFFLRGSGNPEVTDQFLHVDSEHYAVEEDEEGDDTGQSSTFAQTVLIATHDEDAFSLQSVHQQDIRDFYYALGHVKVLTRLAADDVLTDVTNPVHADLYKRARRSIHALIQFCSEDKIEDDEDVVGRANTLHQNILFDLQVQVPLMKVVSLPFHGAHCAEWGKGWRERLTQTQYRHYNKLARDVYRLISYLCRENVHIGLMFANAHLTAMINQCRLIGYLDGINWDIADAIDEMFKDNTILLNRVTKQSIETYLSLIHEAHTTTALEQYLRLLAALCSVDGEAITSTQASIRDLMLVPGAPSADVLPSIANGPSGMRITARVLTPGKPFRAWSTVTLPLQEYLKDHDNLEYFDATLELFAQLCLEGNCQGELRAAARTPFPMIMGALKSQLPPHVKARFCTLLVNLYIDGDDLPDVDHSNRRWQDLANHKSHAKLKTAAVQLFDVDEVVNWVEAYLSQNGLLTYNHEYHSAANSKKPEMIALKQDELHRNMLTEQVVHVALALVNKGLYWDAGSRKRLVRLLLTLLVRTHPGENDDLSATSSLDVVMQAKTLVCRALGACMDANLDEVVTELLTAFKKEYLAHKHKHIEAHADDRALHEVSLIQHNGDHRHFFETDGLSQQQIVHLLLALTTYPSDGLRVAALNLLLRCFNVKGSVLARLSDVVVIADSKDEAALEKLEQLLLTLKHEDHDDLHTAAAHMTEEIEWMCSQCITVNGTLAADLLAPGDSSSSSSKAGRRKRKGVSGPRLPWRKPGVSIEPHHAHQEMMRNANAHKAVLHILHHHLSGADLKTALKDDRARDLFAACFEFLAFFCLHNKHNQELLGHAHDISFFVHACSYGIHAEKVLHRILEGEPDLVQEHVVDEGKVDRLIADLIKEPRCRNVDFLKLMEVIVAPTGTPSRELQDLVGEHFLQAEEKSHLFEHELGSSHFISFIVSTYTKTGGRGDDEDDNGTSAQPLSAREHDLRDFFEQLLSFYAVTAHGNQGTAAHVAKHVPLAELAQPFIDGVTLPTATKSRLLTLIRDVYLLHGTDEDGDGVVDDVDAEDFGFVSAAAKQETCVRLCGPLANELRAIDKGWKHKPSKVRAALDRYAFMTLLPLAADLLRIFVEEHGSVPAERLEEEAVSLVAECVRFLKHRRTVTFESPHYLMDHEYRVLGGHVTGELLKSTLLAQQDALLVNVQTEHTWYDETEAKEARTAAARSTALSMGSKHGSSKRHAFSIDSFAATHSKRGGGGHTRGGGKAPRKVMPVEKVKTEGERIQEELPFFVDQVRETFNHGFSQPHLPWMSFLSTEYNFQPFWALVGILQADLLEDRLHEEEKEAEEAAQGGMLGADGERSGVQSRQGSRPELQRTTTAAAAARSGTFRSLRNRRRSRVHGESMQMNPINLVDVNVDINIRTCLENVMTHFEEAGDHEHHHHEFEEEDEEEAIVGFLAAMSCALTCVVDPKTGRVYQELDDEDNEEAKAAHEAAIATVGRSLNSLGLPDMVLFLLSSNHRCTVLMAAQLGWLMLDATPHVFEAKAAAALMESSIEGGSTLARRQHQQQQERLLSQWAFHDAFESGPMGRRALAAIQRHLQHMQELLFKREHEDPLDRLRRDQDVENLDVAIVHEPILLFLRYLNASDDSEDIPDKDVFHSLTLYVLEAAASLSIWCESYGVVDNGHGDWVQQDGYDVDVDTEHMHALVKSFDLCNALDVIDECCEASILFLLLGVLEGRREGDVVLDMLCAALFPEPYLTRDAHFTQSAFFRLLDGHSAAAESDANMHVREAALQRVAASPHTAHFFDHDVALLYYTVLRILGEQAENYCIRVTHLLNTWEQHSPHSHNARDSVGRIELLRDGELQPVYFQVPAVVHDTKDKLQVRQLRTQMINGTVLENPEQKMQSFFGSVDFLMNVMNFEARVARMGVSYVLGHQRFLLPLAFILAAIINIWVIFDLGDDGFPHSVVRVLAIAHAVVSMLILLGQSLSPLYVDWQRWQEAAEGRSLLGKALAFPLFWSLQASYPYYVVYLAMSVAGIFQFKLFCFHLFDLVLRVEVMNLVLRAVKQNVSKLLGTFLLTFFIIYAFMLVGRDAFGGTYDFADAPATCAPGTPLVQCLRDHLYYGFYSSPVFAPADADVGLFVYSLLYFMVVVLVMAAIVSGIIIDSFGEYRAETEAIAAEKESRCFVCNFSHDRIQAAHKGGFEAHIASDHNVWNYIWFLMRVLEKREEHKPLTGVEIEAVRHWDTSKDLTAMMPVNRALCLEAASEDVTLDQVLDVVKQVAITAERSLQLLLASAAVPASS